MLVTELIEYLKQCNPDARIALSVNEEECTSVDFLDFNTSLNRVCLYEYRPESTSQFVIVSESVAA